MAVDSVSFARHFSSCGWQNIAIIILSCLDVAIQWENDSDRMIVDQKSIIIHHHSSSHPFIVWLCDFITNYSFLVLNLCVQQSEVNLSRIRFRMKVNDIDTHMSHFEQFCHHKHDLYHFQENKCWTHDASIRCSTTRSPNRWKRKSSTSTRAPNWYAIQPT